MKVKLLAVLPNFSMDEDCINLEHARLVKIPFDKILELEAKVRSADYDKQRFKYQKYPPVFFEKIIDVPEITFDSDTYNIVQNLIEIGNPFIQSCICAIHFYTGIAILSPHLSVIYFDFSFDSDFQNNIQLINQFKVAGAYRSLGESDKEYLFHNENPTIYISKNEQESFLQFYQFIDSKSSLINQELWQSICEPLQIISLPGLTNNTKLILMTGALEALIIPDVKQNIKTIFNKRLFVLQNSIEKEDLKWLDKIYTLRSEIVHGNTIEHLLLKLSISYEDLLIKYHRLIIICFCKFLQFANSNENIELQLTHFREELDHIKNDQGIKIKNNILHQWSSNIFYE